MDQMTLPVELNRREIAGLQSTVNSKMIVYGYQPLMVSAQCLMKTTGKCAENPGITNWEDRRHKKFLVHNICAFCYNLIYNTVPLYLMDVLDEGNGSGIGVSRLQFVNKTRRYCRNNGKHASVPFRETGDSWRFLKGHYKEE